MPMVPPDKSNSTRCLPSYVLPQKFSFLFWARARVWRAWRLEAAERAEISDNLSSSAMKELYSVHKFISRSYKPWEWKGLLLLSHFFLFFNVFLMFNLIFSVFFELLTNKSCIHLTYFTTYLIYVSIVIMLIKLINIFKDLFMWTIFKIFIEFVIIFLLFHVLFFWPPRHMGS